MSTLPIYPFHWTGQRLLPLILAVVVLVMSGMLGIALDWGELFVRKGELQRAADRAALAGARELNGRGAGLHAAVASALRAGGEDMTVPAGRIDIRFAVRAEGPWLALAEALDAPAALRFIRVQTGQPAREAAPLWRLPQFDAPLFSKAASATAYGIAGPEIEISGAY